MKKINAEIYVNNPSRYILVSGLQDGAPTCPFGNHFK